MTFTSVTKTFKLSGVQVATCIFPNMEIRDKYEKTLEKFETKINNAFSVVANQVAMNEGKDQVIEVSKYLEDNAIFAMNYISENISSIKYSKSERTYLL